MHLFIALSFTMYFNRSWFFILFFCSSCDRHLQHVSSVFIFSTATAKNNLWEGYCYIIYYTSIHPSILRNTFLFFTSFTIWRASFKWIIEKENDFHFVRWVFFSFLCVKHPKTWKKNGNHFARLKEKWRENY